MSLFPDAIQPISRIQPIARRGHETQAAGARAAASHAGDQARALLQALAQRGYQTREELCHATGVSISSACARMAELIRAGHVEKCGTKLSSHGVHVHAYAITLQGRQALLLGQRRGSVRLYVIPSLVAATMSALWFSSFPQRGEAAGGTHHPAPALSSLCSVEARPAGSGIPVVAGVSPKAGGASPDTQPVKATRRPCRVRPAEGATTNAPSPAASSVETCRGPDGQVAARQSTIMVVTGYCCCHLCTNKHPGDKSYGVTASGKRVAPGMCAADKSVPFGTVYEIPGYGRAVVEDRGGAIRGNRIDVFYRTHAEAIRFGRQTLQVNFYGENQ